MKSLTTRLVVGVAAGFFVSTLASAETIRWARAGDSLTMDPHAQTVFPCMSFFFPSSPLGSFVPISRIPKSRKGIWRVNRNRRRLLQVW